MPYHGNATARIGAVLVLVAALSTACAYPESSTRGRTESPALVVVGAPEGAILVVDGIVAGPAADYSGKKSLSVLPGRHMVELRLGERSLATREVFVDSQGTRTIDFTGVGP